MVQLPGTATRLHDFDSGFITAFAGTESGLSKRRKFHLPLSEWRHGEASPLLTWEFLRASAAVGNAVDGTRIGSRLSSITPGSAQGRTDPTPGSIEGFCQLSRP